jgi:hypothetical protein
LKIEEGYILKIENIVIIVLLIGAGSLIAYFAVAHYLSSTYTSNPLQKISHYDSTNSTDSISLLDLSLSTNTTSLKTGEAIGIDVKLNNTSSKVSIANHLDSWPLKGLGLKPCDSEMPIGIAILQGNYLQNNMTESKPLSLYRNGIYHCQAIFYIKSYVFQPSTDIAIFEDGSLNHSYELIRHLSFYGYFVDDQFQQFSSGSYTVVGGDEWGHVVIQHFVVTNSTGG